MDKNNTKNSNIKKVKNYPKKKRVCKVCKKSISHKRTGTKYCSKKCNNAINGFKRTKRNQKQKRLELENIEKLIKIIPKNKLKLIITYKTESGEYSDHLYQYEVQATKDWINRIIKVIVSGHRKNSKPIVLNNYRARKLINKITLFNANSKKSTISRSDKAI